MSFREKSAWVTLVTLIALTIAFALHVPKPWTLSPAPSPFLFHVLVIAIIAFVAIEVVAHIVLAIFSPRDALAPKDERERLIALKSIAGAAYVYAFLSLASVFTIHLGANQIGVGYLVLLSFVVAEIVQYALRIYYHRRGF